MPRVADTWTNKDIQNNPQGYLEAQRKEREQDEVEREQANLERRKSRFIEDFVRRGGMPEEGEKAFKDYVNREAAEGAASNDRAARESHWRARMRSV